MILWSWGSLRKVRLNSGVLWQRGLFWNPGGAEASELLGFALGAEGSPDHGEVWKTVRWCFWNLGDLSGRWVGGECWRSLKGGGISVALPFPMEVPVFLETSWGRSLGP